VRLVLVGNMNVARCMSRGVVDGLGRDLEFREPDEPADDGLKSKGTIGGALAQEILELVEQSHDLGVVGDQLSYRRSPPVLNRHP
jgi:hypothetical protein